MVILVTGSAGFIGFSLIQKLVQVKEYLIIGIDNINSYYNPVLKLNRLKECGIENIQDRQIITSSKFDNYKFVKGDIADQVLINSLFEKYHFNLVVNLAAQAGVRYSLENPHAYIHSNITGFLNILEACKSYQCKKVVYASSSSVYGDATNFPLLENQLVDAPVSIYAVTKRSNELMAAVYSHLYQINTIGLRFFTVYGPWGRPDMAPMLFAKAIKEGGVIQIFNKGELARDFTYIDDIVYGIYLVMRGHSLHLNDVYNIGRGKAENLLQFIELLENSFGKKVKKIFVGMQPGDVVKTWADTNKLEQDFNYKPQVDLSDGINSVVTWYKEYFK